MQIVIKSFVERIENFYKLPHSTKIVIFGYYLIVECKNELFMPADIKSCYDELLLNSYTNIVGFLNENSTGKKQKFIKKKNGYVLHMNSIQEICNSIGETPERKPTNALIDLELFNNTRDYLKKIFIDACRCYDERLYTASLVMLRKGLEVMIIDLYEKRNQKSKIFNQGKGTYHFLSDLIDILRNDTSVSLNRNTPTALSDIKNYGDMSAHGKFWAIKSDMDKRKESLRIVVADLLNQIDYPNWK